MTDQDGGPAFPHLGLYKGIDGDLHPQATQHSGMTLRDYFAACALSRLLGVGSVLDDVTDKSYLIADMMIEARRK